MHFVPDKILTGFQAFMGEFGKLATEATLYSSSFFLDEPGFAAVLAGTLAGVDFFLGEGNASSLSLDMRAGLASSMTYGGTSTLWAWLSLAAAPPRR